MLVTTEVVTRRRSPQKRRCSILDGVRIERGEPADYRELAPFHYRNTGTPPGIKAVYAARTPRDHLAGVIVYARPSLNLGVRNAIFGDRYRCSGGSAGVNDLRSGRLNAEFELIMRVVVHPSYRGLGLGVRLIAETMPLRVQEVGIRYVEMSAAMGAFNPFARHAGMTPVEVAPSRYTARALAALEAVGVPGDEIGNPGAMIRRIESLPPAQKAFVLKELRDYEMRWVRGRSGRKVNFTLEGVASRIAANATLASTYFLWEAPAADASLAAAK